MGIAAYSSAMSQDGNQLGFWQCSKGGSVAKLEDGPRSPTLEPITEPVLGCLRGMAKPLVSDELWAVVEPLLPPPRPHPNGGRPPVENRAALTGILFVLKSGLTWEMLPQEMGCGMRCWCRLRD